MFSSAACTSIIRRVRLNFAAKGSLEIELTSSVSSRQVFLFPYAGCFSSPGIDTRKKGPSAISVSSERHRQCGVNEVALVSKRQPVVLNPDAVAALPHNHRVHVSFLLCRLSALLRRRSDSKI